MVLRAELEKQKCIVYNARMQIISICHHCLYFKVNKEKFLFGISFTLGQDQSALNKLRPDHIVIPSHPYLPQTSTFLWNLEKASSLCKSVLVSDSPTKKRVEELFQGQALADLKWDFFKSYQLEEETIVMALAEQLACKPLAREPLGVGYNNSLEHLSVIVPEKGCSLVLVRGCDVLVVDPSEQIEQLLSYYGIPLTSLKGIILTNSANLNCFECFLKLPSLLLIATEEIFEQFCSRIKKTFFWSNEMLGSKLKGRVLKAQKKPHRIGGLSCSFVRGTDGKVEFWDLEFGLKKMRVMTQVLTRFPAQIIDLPDLQYLVVTGIDSEVKRLLEKSPQVYRKKVILNRPERKYNNKYFATLNPNHSLLLLTAHPHLHSQLATPSPSLSFQFQNNDPNRLFFSKSLAHRQTFNAAQRVVFLMSGYLQSHDGRIMGTKTRVANSPVLTALERAFFLYESTANAYFFSNQDRLDKQVFRLADSLLSKVRENSFIQGLKLKRERKWGEQEFSSEADADTYEEGSQWDLVNRVGQAKTFEADSQEVDWLNNFYFVIKGVLKFKGTEKVASKNMGMGNLRRFYSCAYQEDEEIQVVKDTWVVQLPLKALDSCFLSGHPERMYELLIKPTVFA